MQITWPTTNRRSTACHGWYGQRWMGCESGLHTGRSTIFCRVIVMNLCGRKQESPYQLKQRADDAWWIGIGSDTSAPNFPAQNPAQKRKRLTDSPACRWQPGKSDL